MAHPAASTSFAGPCLRLGHHRGVIIDAGHLAGMADDARKRDRVGIRTTTDIEEALPRLDMHQRIAALLDLAQERRSGLEVLGIDVAFWLRHTLSPNR